MKLSQYVKVISDKMNAERVERTMATDECVLDRIEELAAHGYIPSDCIIEPIRAILSGYGVLLTGKAGAGKTFLMREMGVRIYSATRLAEWGLSKIAGWYEWWDGKEVCIDDIGTEHIVSEYGAKEDIVKQVISHRCERQEATTHITTNLNSAEISARYGDRTLSRMLGMCKPFAIDGENRRTAKPMARAS